MDKDREELTEARDLLRLAIQALEAEIERPHSGSTPRTYAQQIAFQENNLLERYVALRWILKTRLSAMSSKERRSIEQEIRRLEEKSPLLSEVYENTSFTEKPAIPAVA